ncbi:MAG: hypothetical protein Q9162_001504 [Coniocarpon cinnabarinum]
MSDWMKNFLRRGEGEHGVMGSRLTTPEKSVLQSAEKGQKKVIADLKKAEKNTNDVNKRNQINGSLNTAYTELKNIQGALSDNPGSGERPGSSSLADEHTMK